MTETALFEEICRTLVDAGARSGRMMGRPMLSVQGSMFACLDGDVVGLRLFAGSDDHAEALALSGAELFSPGRSGRIFRDWVALPEGQAHRWEEFAGRAMVATERRSASGFSGPT